MEDFFRVYFVGQNAQSGRCYLSCRPKKNPLILELPDKDDLKDLVIVRGNWEFGPGERDRTLVPRTESDACSKCCNPSFPLLTIGFFDLTNILTLFNADLGVVDRLKTRADPGR